MPSKGRKPKLDLEEQQARERALQRGLSRLPDLFRVWKKGGKAALASHLQAKKTPPG